MIRRRFLEKLLAIYIYVHEQWWLIFSLHRCSIIKFLRIKDVVIIARRYRPPPSSSLLVVIIILFLLLTSFLLHVLTLQFRYHSPFPPPHSLAMSGVPVLLAYIQLHTLIPDGNSHQEFRWVIPMHKHYITSDQVWPFVPHPHSSIAACNIIVRRSCHVPSVLVDAYWMQMFVCIYIVIDGGVCLISFHVLIVYSSCLGAFRRERYVPPWTTNLVGLYKRVYVCVLSWWKKKNEFFMNIYLQYIHNWYMTISLQLQLSTFVVSVFNILYVQYTILTLDTSFTNKDTLPIVRMY